MQQNGASAAAEPPRRVTWEEIPLSAIEPSPLNRRYGENDPRVMQCVESIRSEGLINPISVRPAGGGKYEIICGECRYRALLHLGQEKTLCRVNDCDEKEAQFERIIENRDRSDPTFLEQAEAVRFLLEKYSGSVAEAAAALKWSESMVRRRARLTNLSPAWRVELEKPDTGYGAIADSVLCLEEIALLSQEAQDAMLLQGRLLNAKTIESVRRAVGEFSRRLDAKPWSAAFERSAANTQRCNRCMKRTGAVPGLFDALDPEVGGKTCKKGYCLDVTCWDEKVRAWCKYLLADRRAGDPTVLALYDGYPSKAEVEGIAEYFGEEIIPHADWEDWDPDDRDELPETMEKRTGVFLGGLRFGQTAEVLYLLPVEEAEDAPAESAGRLSAERERIATHTRICNVLSRYVPDTAPPAGFSLAKALAVFLCFEGATDEIPEEDPQSLICEAWTRAEPRIHAVLERQAVNCLAGRDNEFDLYCAFLGLDAAAMLAAMRGEDANDDAEAAG